jgi:hypothetical protein
MKLSNTCLAGLGLACASLLLAVPASAENLDFNLVNKTGYTINEVYVSSAATNDWEEDVLGKDQLENGERAAIEFERDASGCNWDLKVVYDDGEEAEWGRLNLCSISSVTLRYNRDKGETWAETR